MDDWKYDSDLNALYATQRLVWQKAHDWPIFCVSRADASMLLWLRSLDVEDFGYYSSLMPRRELGLELDARQQRIVERLRRRRGEAMSFENSGLRPGPSVVGKLRERMDEYFGQRGRRSRDGMRAYVWRTGGVSMTVEYRLRGGSSLELEFAHETVPRLLPDMLLATPTCMDVVDPEDVDQAVRYVAAWLGECAQLVGFSSADEGSRAE